MDKAAVRFKPVCYSVCPIICALMSLLLGVMCWSQSGKSGTIRESNQASSVGKAHYA